MYILWLSKICGDFCVWKVYQTMPTCQNFPTGQPGKYYQQKTQIFNKRAACSHYYYLWHEHHHWGIGIPSDLRFRPKQFHHLLGTLLPTMTTGNLQSSVPAFNYTKKAFIFTIYDYIFRLWQKYVIFDEINHFSCRVYLSSDIYRMRRPITQPTPVKGIGNQLFKQFLVIVRSPICGCQDLEQFSGNHKDDRYSWIN